MYWANSDYQIFNHVCPTRPSRDVGAFLKTRIPNASANEVQYVHKVKTPTLNPPKHGYSKDGLVTTNPKGAHPIYELIDRAETQWNGKIARQSKTLKEAVKEYKRRYKRPPPKFFDVWYVCMN